jgi:hypothetical protein
MGFLLGFFGNGWVSSIFSGPFKSPQDPGLMISQGRLLNSGKVGPTDLPIKLGQWMTLSPERGRHPKNFSLVNAKEKRKERISRGPLRLLTRL